MLNIYPNLSHVRTRIDFLNNNLVSESSSNQLKLKPKGRWYSAFHKISHKTQNSWLFDRRNIAQNLSKFTKINNLFFSFTYINCT
jgi:hypothetical protein